MSSTSAPSGPLPVATRLRIGLKAIAWFVLTVLFLLGLPVILVWPKWVLAAIAALALLLAVPVFLLRRIRARRRGGYSGKRLYATTAIALLMVLTAGLAAPVYYLAFLVDNRPSLVPLATLSNGKKTVMFQGMVHVGTEGFYKSVVYDLEKALTEGYTLFYEGVKPSPGAGDAWFQKVLGGGGDLNENYKMLSAICGLKFQLDYFAPLLVDMQKQPDRHVTADVTRLDMMNEAERLAKIDPVFARTLAAQLNRAPAAGLTGDSITDTILRSVDQTNEGQKYVVGVLCRGLINMAFSGAKRESGPMSPVILDFRNRFLARQIADSPASKIYITYGAAHLPGVIADLQAIDPAWRVVSVKWSRSLARPERLEGEL